MAKFLITLLWNGEYQYTLIDDNEQTILASEGYYSRTSCETGINWVKAREVNDANFAKMTSIGGKHYFYFITTNGEILGTSEYYESESERDRIIEKAKKYILTANIEDVSV